MEPVSTPSRCLAIGQGPQVDLLADVDAVVTQDRVGRCYVEVEVRDYVLDQVLLTRKRLSFPTRPSKWLRDLTAYLN